MDRHDEQLIRAMLALGNAEPIPAWVKQRYEEYRTMICRVGGGRTSPQTMALLLLGGNGEQPAAIKLPAAMKSSNAVKKKEVLNTAA